MSSGPANNTKGTIHDRRSRYNLGSHRLLRSARFRDDSALLAHREGRPMTQDEQEALSVSLTRGLWCVPLSSGRIAVFDHPARDLRCVVDTWTEVALLPRRLPDLRRAHRL